MEVYFTASVYIFRGTQRPASSYDNDSGPNAPLEIIALFQGIFHKLSPSCFYIVTSSMLEYEYLAREKFWILKIEQPTFAFWFSIKWYNTEQIIMKRCWYLVHGIIISLWEQKMVAIKLSEPTKFDIFSTKYLSVV